jgi:hypothetical protein
VLDGTGRAGASVVLDTTTGTVVGASEAKVGASGALIGSAMEAGDLGAVVGTIAGSAGTDTTIGPIETGGTGARVGFVKTGASFVDGEFWAIGDMIGEFVKGGNGECGGTPSARMVGAVMGDVCGGRTAALEMVNVTRYGIPPQLSVAVMVCEPTRKSRQGEYDRLNFAGATFRDGNDGPTRRRSNEVDNGDIATNFPDGAWTNCKATTLLGARASMDTTEPHGRVLLFPSSSTCF